MLTNRTSNRRLLRYSAVRLAPLLGTLLIGRGARLLWSLAIARWLTVGEYGAFTWIIALALLVQTVTDSGADVVMTRRIAIDNLGRADALVASLGLKLLYVLIVATLGAIAVSWSWISSIDAVLVVLVALIGSLYATVSTYFQALFNYGLTLRASMTRAAILGICFATVVVGLWPRALTSALVPMILADVGAVCVVLGRLPRMRAFVPSQTTATEASIIGFGSMLASAYSRVPVLALSAIGVAAALGIFGAGTRVIDAIAIVPATVSLVTYPGLCRLVHDKPRWARASRQLQTAAAGIGLLACIAIATSADAIVHFVFGPRYLGASVLLMGMSALLPLIFLNPVGTSILYSCHRSSSVTVIAALNLATCLLCAVLLVPRFGAGGAVMTWVVTEGVNAIAHAIALPVDAARPWLSAAAVATSGAWVLASQAHMLGLLLLLSLPLALVIAHDGWRWRFEVLDTIRDFQHILASEPALGTAHANGRSSP